MPAQSGSLPGPSTTGRYTYRAKVPARSQTVAKGERAKLTHALATHRQLLSHASSAIRTLTAARNEMIAQALEDGLTLATISAVTGENIRAVRTIGLAYDDLHPSGLTRGAHVDGLRAKSEQLKAAERHRDRIVNQREALIVTALRTQACDDLELASLTGLTPEHIRRSTRGIARSA
ncbi:hypothetical protein [Arthrobacter bambusae]|uniref:Uncharacterized protein n=1 Tax=Arthrobacter bambusae TaxID=1338426 RepID=A0AAW8DN25_9MICC|nr:hypothetical protein [Arthrobacter bambusae]MDP9907805.1 hypothetical protein [Arthrobacter bambusae]MDQ0130615.1 hypothetical protein [Arthrobacter bambusae]MDQ0182004.1 hypothetical protein [Arthrobacter bambusae]